MSIRVAFWSPGLLMGGAERWIASLCKHLDPKEAAPVAVITDERGVLASEVERICPVVASSEWDHAADVLVMWGSTMPACVAAFKGPIVGVAHCAGDHPGAAGVVAHIESVAQHLVGVSPAATASFSRPATTILNGVEMDRITPRDPDRLRKRLGIKPDEKVLLYLGRFAKVKNTWFTEAVAAELPAGWVTVMAGPDMGHRPAPSRHLIVAEPDAHVGDFLAIADASILPSDTEAFSLSMIEAWAASVPTYVYNWSVMSYLRESYGEVAHTFDSRDPQVWAKKIAEGAHFEGLEVRARARRVAWREFSATRMAAKWAAYLREVVGAC